MNSLQRTNGIFCRKFLFIILCGTRLVTDATSPKSRNNNATDLCRDYPDGRYPDHRNCCGFIQCLNHFPYEEVCPLGLMFNSKLQECDWPDNVHCQVPAPENAIGEWINGVYTGCKLEGLHSMAHEVVRKQRTASEVLQTLVNITTLQPSKRLHEKDLMTSLITLMRLVNYKQHYSHDVMNSKQDQRRFFQTASNLLDEQNIATWREIQTKTAPNGVSSRLIKVLDDYGLQVVQGMEINDSTSIILTKNLATKMARLDHILQGNFKPCFQHQDSSVCLPTEMFNNSLFHGAVNIIYFNLNQVLLLGAPNSTGLVARHPTVHPVHSTVVSSTVSSRSLEKMNATVKIVLQNRYFSNHLPRRSCVFWEYNNPVTTWLSRGCHVIPEESNAEVTACRCTHMTLFAVLMDPLGVEVSHADQCVLELISTTGCSISCLALMLTMLVTLLFWRKLKSARTKVLMNLCLSLAAACLLVIIAGSARDHKVRCKTVAVSLHYILLSAFCWMLCEGILLYCITTFTISSHEDKLRYFHLLGWGCPAAIVMVTLAVTQTDGYGSTKACWLTVDGGLIWAFIAPAVVIIFINATFLIIVLRKTLSTRLMLTRTQLQRVRGAFKAAVVSLPLLGITWVVGLLTFNSDTVSFRYVFAALNSLQGLMIFTFHCALNKQVQKILALKISQLRQRFTFAPRVAPAVRKPFNLMNRFGNPSSLSTVSKLAIPRLVLQEVKDEDVHTMMKDNFTQF